MRRLLLCLSLCFVLSPETLPRDEPAGTPALRDVADDEKALPDAATYGDTGRDTLGNKPASGTKNLIYGEVCGLG